MLFRSQTKSNTQRPLMYPDEIMRMDNRECLVLLRGQKPLRLYKIIPDEHPSFGQLRDVKVSDYVPHWRQGEENPKADPAPHPEPSKEPPASSAGKEDAHTAPPASAPMKNTDSVPPAKAPGGWAPKYDYGLLDPVDGFDGAGQDPDSCQGASYGGFDLIEASPEDVGGEHQAGQR